MPNPWTETGGPVSAPSDASVAQDDLAAILRALGLGDHARPQSPHEVVRSEVLPRIQAWRVALEWFEKAAEKVMSLPTTPGHEEAHREMEEQFRQAAPDPCADLPDAPVPQPFRSPPGTYARHGGKKPKNLYLVTPDCPEGLDIGRLDTPEMAALVVEALNLALRGRTHNDAEEGNGG